MSVQATTWVWDHSAASGSDLLVLLAIADAANKQGHNSCQSAATMAAMARVSERTVWRSIKSLTTSGQIEKQGESELYGTAIYRLPLMGKSTPDNLTPPDTQGDRPLTSATSGYDTDGTQPQDTYPSVNPNSSSPTADATDEEKDRAFIIEALCQQLAKWVAANTGSKEKPVGERWRTACRRMIEIDGHDPREMWRVLDWSQRDEFWQANVQSFDTFRKQYGKLKVRAKTGSNGERKSNADRGLELLRELEQAESAPGGQLELLGTGDISNGRQISLEAAELHLGMGQPGGIQNGGGRLGAWPT